MKNGPRPWKSWEGSCNERNHYHGSVSYTHLDVYKRQVQRPLNYAIVDEVDSILIDEARTPLIISGQGDAPKALYQQMAGVIPRLKNEQDYTLDEKAKRAKMCIRDRADRL